MRLASVPVYEDVWCTKLNVGGLRGSNKVLRGFKRDPEGVRRYQGLSGDLWKVLDRFYSVSVDFEEISWTLKMGNLRPSINQGFNKGTIIRDYFSVYFYFRNSNMYDSTRNSTINYFCDGLENSLSNSSEITTEIFQKYLLGCIWV